MRETAPSTTGPDLPGSRLAGQDRDPTRKARQLLVRCLRRTLEHSERVLSEVHDEAARVDRRYDAASRSLRAQLDALRVR